MSRRQETPMDKKNWKRPVRFPVHMTEALYQAINDRKWAEHKSMAQIVNEVLEKEFLK